MQYFQRSTWTSTPRPVSKLAALNGSEVEGIAIHYTGSSRPLGSGTSLAVTARHLEAERRFHAGAPPEGRGWGDIAYQAAIDVEGRVFDCRGIGYRSDANGNATANREYGAVTWLLGVGDRPTSALVNAFRQWRQDHWLPRYPRATKVVGHRDLYATDCPGDPAYALILSGALTKGVDVPLTNAEIDAIATRTRDKILAVTYGNQPDGQPFTLAMLWGEVRVNAIKAATGIDIDALASAIISRLPPGQGGQLDAQALAVAVADELAIRLRS
ncbi:MAG: hypothetical protein QG622_2427 [Actinomycetota bacterium]|nr:hypothetical protein [Actinomycetota bacterium]